MQFSGGLLVSSKCLSNGTTYLAPWHLGRIMKRFGKSVRGHYLGTSNVPRGEDVSTVLLPTTDAAATPMTKPVRG